MSKHSQKSVTNPLLDKLELRCTELEDSFQWLRVQVKQMRLDAKILADRDGSGSYAIVSGL